MFIAYHTDDVNSKLYQITDFSLVPRALVRTFDSATAIVAGALIRFAGKNGKCFPRQKKIQVATGLSSYQVTSAVKKLRDMCMIDTTQGRFGALSYKFLWHPHWNACLQKGVESDLKSGEQFIPHDMFNCTVLPSHITSCSDIKANEKVMLAYMLCKMGADGMAWPKQEKIADELGMTTKTVGLLLQKLIDKKLIRKITKPGPWPHTYVAVYHKVLSSCMKYVETKKHSRKILDRLLSILRSDKENHCKVNQSTWSDSVESSQVNHYETAEAEKVEVLTEKEFLDSIPSIYVREKFTEWLNEIPQNVSTEARLSIAARMMTSRGLIKNKGAYISTLIRKTLEGTYVIAGLQETLNTLVRWSHGIARQHG